jgi:hypothetical protein
MISNQNNYKYLPIFQTSKTAAATATGIIDTLGYDYATIDVLLPTADVVSNCPTVLKLQEADTTNATSFANITGFVGGTDFTIPNALTAATQITGPFCTFNVDCKARKRYLQVAISPATTQVVNVLAQLSRGEQAPVGTAQNSTVVVNG